ncbi:MAG: neuromedin U [Gammaproteobacteria bacterium]|nr:neuromedin U [Gammaproteobacteria bacterium]
MSNRQCANTIVETLVVLFLMLTVFGIALASEGDGIIEPGEDSTEELARAVQNPVASLISVPFQNNTNFNFGPREKTQNVMNIQPVVPFSLSEKWNLITRTILPIISQPAFTLNQSRKDGLGDTLFTAFLSPKNSGSLIWGAGPAILIPTSTDDRLGAGEWGAGPGVVFLTIQGPWVVGSLFSNVWSFTGDSDVNIFTWQPFVNYNLDGGWYLTTSPLITANWEADSDNTWTVPVGGGFGRVFRVGQQNLNMQLQSFYNIEEPDDIGPEWSIRFQVQFLFPK